MLNYLLVSAIFLLVACAPTTSTDSNSDPVATRDGVENTDSGSSFGLNDTSQVTGFTAETDGAEILTISENGTLNCENGVYVIRNSLDTFPQISLILPQNVSPGNFNLVNNPGDGSAASATVFFQDGRVFANNVEGIVIVNALATEPGQAVSGSFDFSAWSGGDFINVRGVFDFVSGDNAVYCS